MALLCSFFANAQTSTWNGCAIYTGNDPNTSNPVDDPHIARTMWVNNFADFTIVSPSAGVPDEVAIEPDQIFCSGNWISADNLFQEEKDFLEYATGNAAAEGANLDRIVLYTVGSLLDYADYEVYDLSGAAQSLSVEEHLERFFLIAKQDYDLEISVVLSASQSVNNPGLWDNLEEFYDFSLVTSNVEEYFVNYTGGDPCASYPSMGPAIDTESFDTIANEDYETYFDTALHGTIFPVDTTNDTAYLHPYDYLRNQIWNVRVFNSRDSLLDASIRSSLSGLPARPPKSETYCGGVDRVVPEIEFWKSQEFNSGQTYNINNANCNNAETIYDISDPYRYFITALEYSNCASDMLPTCGWKTDAWIGRLSSFSDAACGSHYLMFDLSNNWLNPTTTTVNEDMASDIEALTDEVYLAAFKNTPCKAYYSSGASTQRHFKYLVETFNATSTSGKYVPLFNTRNFSGGLHDFLSLRTPGDAFNGTFGKAETVVYNELFNHPDWSTWTDDLEGYAWYRSQDALEHNFYKNDPTSGVEDFSQAAFSIYPNPANNEVQVVFGNNHRSFSVEIYTMNGVLVAHSQNSASTQVLDISELSSGIYLVKAGDYVKKLIVNSTKN